MGRRAARARVVAIARTAKTVGTALNAPLWQRYRHPEVRAAFGAPRRMLFSTARAAILRGAQERAPQDDVALCGNDGLILPDGQITRCCVQPLLQKYFCFLLGQITCLFLAIPS
jgi:hypothetical protein